MADLDTNQFTLEIDGKQRASALAFRNRPWFREADQLAFDGREALLDNILVLPLPSTAPKTARLSPARAAKTV
jgi:hypothetical protein